MKYLIVLLVLVFSAFVLALPALAHADSAVLTWVDNSSNESGFKIQRQLNGSAFADVTTLAVGANIVTVTDATLVQGAVDNVYCYRLYAFNSAGNSGFTNSACKTIAALVTIPVAPSNLTIQ